MEEIGGFLMGVAVVIAIIFFAIKLALLALAGAFLASSDFLGHPLIFISLLCVVGGAIGLARYQKKHGKAVAKNSDDYALIGGLKMLPEEWAVAVLCLFAGVVGLFGIFLV